jgi:type 1 glutamine amidotransferase
MAKIKMQKCGVKILIILAFVVLLITSAAQGTQLKALIVTGQSNQYHNWKISSPVFKQLLEETGLFKVDTAITLADSNVPFEPNFAAYNVVVLDYEGKDWPQKTQQAFVDYVKSGGGVVVYHAADNAFPQWKEYNQIIGLGGWGNRDEKSGPMVRWRDGKMVLDNTPGKAGTHPPAHDFQIVNRNPEHPVMKGLPEKWMHASDEVYSKLRGPAENLTVLATAYSDPNMKNKWVAGSGEIEPVLFTINYGKGRIFHTTLGHANKPPFPALENVDFIVTFQRGAEWAATGSVTQKVPADFPTMVKTSRRQLNIQPAEVKN